MPDDRKEKETDREKLYKSVEHKAYEDLFKYIRTEIISNKKIIPITSLSTNPLLSLVELKTCMSPQGGTYTDVFSMSLGNQ